jgi:hypothetical protein
MKNLLLILILALCATQTFAQQKLTEYESSYFGKSYAVNVAKSKEGKISFYIDLESMDKTSKTGFVIIEEKDLESFLSSIQASKEMYAKWKKTAIDNNVTELSKEMNVPKFKCSAGFSYGKWQFDFSVLPSSSFKIINGKYLTILHSGELQSSSNQFMKSSGIAIVFDDEKAFDSLIAAVNLTKAKELLDKKDKAASLFE